MSKKDRYTDRQKYYRLVEQGLAKNDYTNSFLNHFGFCAPELEERDSYNRKKYYRSTIALRGGTIDAE